jgi:hypothetical protein
MADETVDGGRTGRRGVGFMGFVREGFGNVQATSSWTFSKRLETSSREPANESVTRGPPYRGWLLAARWGWVVTTD